jgi:P27 family predicted phage terminase small subunit
MRRKTITEKIREGDRRQRGKHVLQRQLAREPHPPRGLPDPPAHLSGRAREAWNFWREQLKVMDLDCACDAVALEAACVAYARGCEAELVVSREGAIVAEPIIYRGVPIPGEFRRRRHPASVVAAAQWQLLKVFVAQFGLSPLSRTRLTVDRKSSDAVDLNKLLSGPRLSDAERRKLQ